MEALRNKFKIQLEQKEDVIANQKRCLLDAVDKADRCERNLESKITENS